MASFRKSGAGWRAEVERHGIRTSKTLPTKREAQAWAIREEARLDALKGSGGKTLQGVVDHYLKTVSTEKRKGAVAWESARFASMVDFFGDVALSSITSETIGRWRDKRKETVGGSTIQREAALLKHLFTLSVEEWRWLDRNPFVGVRMPKKQEARKQLWHWRQIRQVLRAGQRSGGKLLEVTQAFHLSLRSGMRLQEALMAPAHFDPVKRVVTVPTKTSERPDQIPIGRIAAKLLMRKPFVVQPKEASVLFSTLTDRLMIDGLTYHDSRATALTHLAKKVDVMVLARVSRHRDISLLHRVYYRATAEEIARKI